MSKNKRKRVDLPLTTAMVEQESNSHVDIYADDTTIWETNSDTLLTQRSLRDSLDRTSRSLSLNKMVPKTKKTKHLIIGTVQKLLHSGDPSLDLSLCGTPIEEAKDEKLLGVKQGRIQDFKRGGGWQTIFIEGW